ncbi:hypothetical protein [Paraglaciecola sp. MB-3u-78]|jgi:hypothetical protein|uniref:hypothetical protein n=1 Tax=Paraglaciecola sp. MB-3u-78 TaxID=2058332 RepID=UPI000C33342B|nr:hypothetical protein [Paraglaciecola sp. MB-3u-78]PKG96749.1 hypothetical protein CXF95_23320 [Paraglaciecola sp. MB-3u-78]
MKIYIFILLTIVVGCTSQPNKEYVQESELETVTEGSHSQILKKIVPVGVWEGISRSGAEFKVLKITPDNQHSLTSYKIASGMQVYKKITFANEDIRCDKFNCHLYTRTEDERLQLKITLTEFIGQDYLVTEAVKLASGEISSLSYELKTTKEKSTPERFIAKESKKITAIVSENKKGRFGYWSGILEVSNEEQLKFATLEYLPEQAATFTVYTPGFPFQAIMTFDPEWLKQSDGELTTKLEGAPFASEITLRYQMWNMIDGNFEQRFERYPERLIAHGNFRLYRVKSPEDFKPPKWLKSMLEKLE